MSLVEGNFVEAIIVIGLFAALSVAMIAQAAVSITEAVTLNAKDQKLM